MPSEELEVIKNRVSYFKIFFLQRRLKLINVAKQEIIENFEKSFDELGLEDGAQLMLGNLKPLSKEI